MGAGGQQQQAPPAWALVLSISALAATRAAVNKLRLRNMIWFSPLKS
jgi:hypothetical protein